MAQSLAKRLNTVPGAGAMRLTKKSKGTNRYGNTGVYGRTTQVAVGYENFIRVLMVRHWMECALLLSYN